MWPTRGISENGERIQVSRQSNPGCLPPGMLLVVNDQHPGQQLDLMTESVEGECARQKRRIHKDALAKGQIVRHRPRLAEGHRARRQRISRGVIGARETYL